MNHSLTILEVGGLGGIVVMIISMIVVVAFVFGLVVAAIMKLIYESGGDKKYSKSNFWLTVLIVMLICGLISGVICGGM
ncbi:hypothetical protein ACH34E_06575 [Elizabethkingia anophelis]|uniref:hypothetical protein n=2 Tax=Elizabethkingia anophelis TaxID=1117645 RepID=UPI000442B6C7|nr:hypothetical protein [Elizabethkingia anophelis]MCT3802366.1 hypothetical protein [Elizabethkingia anophelis]MCT4059294.1 hypothetical protein [Elizabethkingia anophelis]MCT4069903.1 hypothetical protein [Elizabethkingia anophelis]MCT4330635.1 hypothetical protein [Elizabethkingia anophelis]OCW73174.1 hypothetical protein A4G24_15980 [Elizabethkingia anophelis]